MKNLISILLFSIMISCTTNKIDHSLMDKNDSLSLTESNIINDFLENELTSDRYKNYKNYPYVLIQEALMKKKALDSYLYSYEQESLIKSTDLTKEIDKKLYFLDSVKIKNVKNNLTNEKAYSWKIKDIKKIKVSLLKTQELRKMIQTNNLFIDSGRLLIYISIPLIIDRDTAFISYEIDNCRYVCNNITHFTVLMKKVDGKWIQSAYYEDGVFY